MLKNIPPIISPQLLKVLCEMGHGDRIVLADANFPAESMGKNAQVVRCDGHGIPELLKAVLVLFPLDTYVEKPVSLMQVVEGDNTPTPIWENYEEQVLNSTMKDNQIRHVERFDFYEEAKTAYAIVATGETALYANIMLQKGVVEHNQG